MGRTWRKKKNTKTGKAIKQLLKCVVEQADPTRSRKFSEYTDVDRTWMISMKQLITSRHPKYCQKLYPYLSYRCRRGPRILSLGSKVYNWGYCLITTRVWGTYDLASLLKVWSLYSYIITIVFPNTWTPYMSALKTGFPISLLLGPTGHVVLFCRTLQPSWNSDDITQFFHVLIIFLLAYAPKFHLLPPAAFWVDDRCLEAILHFVLCYF